MVSTVCSVVVSGVVVAAVVVVGSVFLGGAGFFAGRLRAEVVVGTVTGVTICSPVVTATSASVAGGAESRGLTVARERNAEGGATAAESDDRDERGDGPLRAADEPPAASAIPVVRGVEPALHGRARLVGLQEAQQEERAVALRRLAHARERILAALAALEVPERLLQTRSLPLAVEMRRKEWQVAPALLREPLGIDLREPQLDAEAFAGPEDELRDRVLLHVHELADLGIRAVLELAQGEHEPLPRLQLRVREPDLVLLSSQERSPFRVVFDRRRSTGSGTSAIGCCRFVRSTCFRKRLRRVVKRYAPTSAVSGSSWSSRGTARTNVSCTRSSASWTLPARR